MFGSSGLDERNWVVDFGSLADFKQVLVDNFDHKTVVAADDPEIEWFREAERRGILKLNVLPAVGCEMFAKFIYDAFSAMLPNYGYGPDRVWVEAVEVSEHGANSAIYRNQRCCQATRPEQ